MLDDKSLLELCVSVSGKFEDDAGASYTDLTGNEDGEGISVGVLQWCAGQGSLQTLLKAIAAQMGWPKAQSFFKSDIQQLANSSTTDAVQFCKDHYLIAGSTKIDPGAAAKWVSFLSQPESISAQVALAANTVLAHAKREVTAFTPDYTDRVRPYAFFFDVCTQEGGMAVGQTVVPAVPSGQVPDVSSIVAYASTQNAACSAIWASKLPGDSLASLLLHYAYARASMARPEYLWDACSRRGTIACRGGVVHGSTIDLTALLD